MKVRCLILGVMLIASCTYDQEELATPFEPLEEPIETCDTTKTTYCAKVKTLVSNSCAISGCHEADSPFGDFTSYGKLKKAVNNGSLKIRVIIDKDMPPSSPLSYKDRQVIDDWITAGAPEH